MIVGCLRHHNRFNGSACCAKFFHPNVHVNGFGSCVTTAGREPRLRENAAVVMRGLTVLVKMNPDRIRKRPKNLFILIQLLSKNVVKNSVRPDHRLGRSDGETGHHLLRVPPERLQLRLAPLRGLHGGPWHRRSHRPLFNQSRFPKIGHVQETMKKPKTICNADGQFGVQEFATVAIRLRF